MADKPFRGLSLGAPAGPRIKRRYSLTQDVVSFRRCARQYGTFRVHNYAPAHQTQLYFGTVIHQVLDHAHAHYHGIVDPATRGRIPTDDEIQQYFDEVEQGLKSRGIRAISPLLRDKAIRIIQYFNQLEGPELYPRVIDTEHRLQADRQDHILHGVVDLLARGPGGSTDPGECEMWDYKGSNRLGLKRRDLETYEFQMRVYAHLYELKHKVLPSRAVLYFLNELDGPTPPRRRPVNAVIEVGLERAEIDRSVGEFTRTVREIEEARRRDRWDPAAAGQISEHDCTICDLRWDCPTPNQGMGVLLRYP